MTERYYRKVRDTENPNLDTLSSEYSGESEKLEMEWPMFGNSPKQPKND